MKDKINIDNYEAYFLDFIEGNLSDIQIEQLNKFLALYPELKAELDGFENITLDESIKEKSQLQYSLKREESTGLLESEYLMIAQIENIITTEEKAKLATTINDNPHLLKDLSIYHKTKLPKEELIFKAKDSLFQKEESKIVWWHYAAVVAVLTIMFFSWNPPTTKYNPYTFNRIERKAIQPSSTEFAFVVKENSPSPKIKAALPKPKIHTPPPPKKIQPQEMNAETTDELIAETINTIPPHVEEKTNDNKRDTIIPLTSKIEIEDNVIANNHVEYTPINEYAKDKIQTQISKGKTLSESIIDELKNKAKEKLKLESEKNNNGHQILAFNIGKLSFSRSK